MEPYPELSDSFSRQSGEWGSKEGPEHQEAPTLTAEHVPSGQLVLASSLLSCGLLADPFASPFDFLTPP